MHLESIGTMEKPKMNLWFECEIEADVEPLECEIEGLTPAMKHIVVGYACLLGSLGCSEGIEESFWTPPMGKTVLLFFDYKLKI